MKTKWILSRSGLLSLLVLGLCLAMIQVAGAAAFANTGSLAIGRELHTATLLPNGKVLVAGGEGNSSGVCELYDPATCTWTETGSLATAREYHTATLLPNGKVLVTGGYSGSVSLASAELYDPATGTWTATGSLATARYFHKATLLPNGKVLVTGGEGSSGYLASAELYDPATGSWTATGSLATARLAHTATVLPNGKVLATGGWTGSVSLASAELYDPATGIWTATGALLAARRVHTATLLPNGKVLVTGGYGSSALLASAELYDPATGSWTATGTMTTARDVHTATLLPNGKVLVTGGFNGSSSLANSELYDPATGAWTATGSLANARYYHTATLLPNGKVLVTGGYDNGNYLASAELYDYAAGIFSSSGSLATGRYAHTATLLPNGKVLVTGGLNVFNGSSLVSCELYDPATGTWTATGSLSSGRMWHTATLLPNGKVLVTGGSSGSGTYLGCELYDPATGTWTATGYMSGGRQQHTATLLANGKVLVIGGYDGSAYLTSCELYDPATGTWRGTGSLITIRDNHTATLLPNGKVLVAGGYGDSFGTCELYDPATGNWTATGTMSTGRYDHTATLLPNGKVLVTAGFNGATYLTSAELYDPATGTWTTTGSLTTIGRYDHRATLLPNGKVLVTGGYKITDPNLFLASCELYDPATGTWSATSSLGTARDRQTATLLPNGKVLVAGGEGTSGVLASAELYDVGLGFNSVWQPQISTFTSPLISGGPLALGGTRFLGISGGSGGNLQDSPANNPVVQLRRLDNEQLLFLNATNWGTNSYTSTAITNLPSGWVQATMFVNGIPGPSVMAPLITPAQIITQPANQTVLLTSNATVSVTASGDALLVYRWFFNGTPISGGTNSSLIVSNASLANSGNYQVIITNGYGSVTSSVATLTVLLPATGGIVFQDTFDPSTASSMSSYFGGDATNVSVGVTAGVGVGNTAALQIQSSFNNGPNGYGYMAGQWQDSVVYPGNTDTNLSHYVLSFDALVTGDSAHQSGGGFALTIQESAGQYFGPTFPQGTLQTYQGYQGGSDLLVPQSGVWKHFDINLGGSAFQGTNGFNQNFNPTGQTWQVTFQMNAGTWGNEPQTNSTLLIDNLTLATGIAPTITQQPVTQMQMNGSNLNFSVTTYGSGPFTYQWLFNGATIAGATNSSLTISNTTLANAGSYQVVVSNPFGTLTSDSVDTTPFSVNWFKVAGGGGTSTGDVFAVSGTFGQHDAGGPMQGGGFSVMSGYWSPLGTATYNPAGTPPAISNVINPGITSGTAFFGFGVTGTPPIFYQWQRFGFNGYSNLLDGAGIAGGTNAGLSLTIASNNYNGSYQLIAVSPYGSLTSSVVNVGYYAPFASPVFQYVTNTVGSFVGFSVTASGNPPPSYQWLVGGVPIPGATGAGLSFIATNAGIFAYSVQLQNAIGTATYGIAQLVTTNGTAPQITQQPQSLTNAIGSLVNFSVTASGAPVPTYQWRLNGTIIAGANGTNYSLLATNGGGFDVVLANYYGSITSSVATLTLTNGSAPVILAQPQSRTNPLGSVATFSVTASGNPSPTYQWRLNGAAVPGALSSTYSFTALSPGNYDVVAANYYGSVTSSVAVLTVTNGSGYVVSSNVPFSFVDISATGTRVLAGVDDASVGANIGFTFNFFGADYTSLFIDVNGLISFSAGTAEYSNVDLKSTSPVANVPCIAVLWDDWVTLGAGAAAVYYQTLGNAGNRQFVVQWNNLFGYSTSPSTVTFEAILSEADKSIICQYLDVDSGDFRTNGASATVGIRNTSGQLTGQSLQWSANQPVILNGEAIQFSVLPAGYNQVVGQLLTGGKMRLSYVGLAGTNYALDRTFNLKPVINWAPQATNPADGNGILVFTNTPVPATNNFWRVRSVP